MKKLFFTALVAVVAVGGAFATSARFATFYLAGSNTAITDCTGGTIACSVNYPGTYYNVPASSGNQGQPGTLVNLSDLDDFPNP